MSENLGRLLARGNTSDVYVWGVDSVAKVLRPGVPEEWAEREARTTDRVHEAGFPAPAVGELTTVDGRPAIVFSRVRGRTMWDEMLEDVDSIPRLAQLLFGLQSEVHAADVPSGLPNIGAALAVKIEQANGLDDAARSEAQRVLARLPTGRRLCHFDVHPGNVMFGPDGPVFIDWFDAVVGPAEADVARASLLMRADAAGGHLPVEDGTLVEVAHAAYLEAALASRTLDPDLLLQWEQPALAARLSEPLVPASWYAARAVLIDPDSSPLRAVVRRRRASDVAE